jgi:ABC-type amino acid transport substrate-binding protein
LTNKTVADVRGNSIVDLLKAQYPDIRILLFDHGEKALRAVASGEVDAIIANLTLGSHLINKRGLTNLKVAAPSPFENHPFAFGIRKDWPELAGIIDKAVDTISAEERLAIQGRYLSPIS